MEIPEDEKWLFNNPEVLALVQRGIDDAIQGRVSRVPLELSNKLIAINNVLYIDRVRILSSYQMNYCEEYGRFPNELECLTWFMGYVGMN